VSFVQATRRAIDRKDRKGSVRHLVLWVIGLTVIVSDR
jgi:hypothetical protein